MIVPRNRLLFWFAIIVPPFSFLGAVEPAAVGVSMLALGGFLAVSLIDALRARRMLAGMRVQLPLLVRMSKDRDGKIEVRIQNERQGPMTLRLALALPKEIPSEQEETIIALPSASEWSRFSWACRPAKRGNYRVHSAHLETSSPFGFWSTRGR